MIHTQLLTCPICGLPLAHSTQMLKCPGEHSFDVAREGYVNLLLKRQLGDTREMLLARRSFLERGHYRPLSDAINELVSSHLHEAGVAHPANILDAGCGEGYYLGQLQSYLAGHATDILCTYTGIDISKEAVKMAARRYQEACFVVANLKERLVFADQALHVILNTFAPRNTAEFARVLAPLGLQLVVIPSATHLLQLRSKLHLLNIEEQKQQRVIEQYAGHFTLITSREITYELNLKREEISLAVTMTPNYWHLSEETRQAMAELEDIRTEVGFTCLAFRHR